MELTMEQEEKLNEWLNENFKPFGTCTPAGNPYQAYPVFVRLKGHAQLSNDTFGYVCDVTDVGKIRVRQYSPNQRPGDTTGTYAVAYEFCHSGEYDTAVALVSSLGKESTMLVLDLLKESLTENQMDDLGEMLFNIDKVNV